MARGDHILIVNTHVVHLTLIDPALKSALVGMFMVIWSVAMVNATYPTTATAACNLHHHLLVAVVIIVILLLARIRVSGVEVMIVVETVVTVVTGLHRATNLRVAIGLLTAITHPTVIALLHTVIALHTAERANEEEHEVVLVAGRGRPEEVVAVGIPVGAVVMVTQIVENRLEEAIAPMTTDMMTTFLCLHRLLK
jgi:hypothetical protein